MFTSLPTEVLNLIGRKLSQQDVSSLSRTSHWMRSVFEQLLYTNVTLLDSDVRAKFSLQFRIQHRSKSAIGQLCSVSDR